MELEKLQYFKQVVEILSMDCGLPYSQLEIIDMLPESIITKEHAQDLKDFIEMDWENFPGPLFTHVDSDYMDWLRTTI